MGDPFDVRGVLGENFVPRLIREVLAAGAEARGIAERGLRAEMKRDLSPVTEADRRVEARLRAFLEAAVPGAAILGEEDGASGADSNLVFHVDPIDGTRAFLRGIPSWSILIGLEDAGVPVFGLAYMPADDDLFIGSLGSGAFLNGRPLALSEVERLGESVISHGGLQQFQAGADFAMLERLAGASYTARGFADFDGYRQLLLGRVDAMVDPDVKSYDICAAAVLVREAGGCFTDLEGRETIHGGSGLASNGRIHDALLEVVRA
jgi:histidinol-phosphatase